MNKLIYKWHTKLDMPKYDLDWHKQDMAEELAEYNESTGIVHRWSELSDVVYTYTRAVWSGHTEIVFPFSKFKFFIGLLYMFPKYTLRWRFFRALGKKFDPNLNITEVRNPQKLHKLDNIAKKYNLDPVKFIAEAKKLIRYRIFLK